MKGRKIHTTEAHSVTVSIVIGVLISVILSALLSMIIAMLVLNGTLEDTNINYACLATLLIASIAGTLFGSKTTAGKYGVVCPIIAIIFGFLLIGSNILFFDGVFKGFLIKSVMILLGCSISCVLFMKPAVRRKYKRHYR